MAATHETADYGGYSPEDIYPPHHGMSPSTYLATRVKTLKPPMNKAPNPIRLLMMLTRHDWAFFSIAFIAWVSPLPLLPTVGSVLIAIWCPADLGRL